MKITFEFKDDSKELEIKKLIKSFYKAALGAIEGRFDEDDEEEVKELEEFKRSINMESTKNSIILNLDSSILNDVDIEDYKEALMSESLKQIF